MHVFWHEWRRLWKSQLVWYLVILLTLASGMSKYQVYAKSGPAINQMVADIPQALKVLLGIRDFPLTEITGFFGMLSIYLMLMLAIHACMLGANLIAQEERDHTVEFLMVKPISRTQVIFAKWGVALSAVVAIFLVTLGSTLWIAGSYTQRSDEIKSLTEMMLGIGCVQILFMCVGSAVAGWSRNPKHTASRVMVIVVGCYLLSVLADYGDWLSGLAYLTPFAYFSPERILEEHQLNLGFILLSAVLTAGMLTSTIWKYRRRDLKM